MATSALTTTDPQLARPPVPMTASLDHAVRHFASRMTAVGLRHEIAAMDAPSPAEREALSRRHAALVHWLAPADGRALLDEVAKLFLMPARSASADDTKVRMKVFAQDVADLPLFAIVQACADFRQGRVGDTFRPTQAEVRQRALGLIEGHHRERLQIERVLDARIVDTRSDPERRKQIAELARASIRDGHIAAERANEAAMRIKPRQEKVESAEEFAARMKSPVRLSDAARATIPHLAEQDRQDRQEQQGDAA